MSSMSELIQKSNKTLKNIRLIEKIRFWQKIDYLGFFDVFKYKLSINQNQKIIVPISTKN